MSPRPPLLFTPHSPFLLPRPVPTPQRLQHHHRLKPSTLCAAAAAASTRPQRQRRLLASPLAVSGGGGGDDFFTVDYDPDYDDGFDEELGSPWEGAVVYRRDAAVHHVECGTSLERLGLGELSSPESRARAAAMGIRGRKAAALGEGEETPVLVSVDVARRRGRLRIDGIVRTVITLGCYRCAEPAPEGVFANFSLLLTEDPVEEPDVVDLGTIYEEDRTKAPLSASSKDDDDDIDWDDRLHFPAGAMEIDISKHIRDIIHLEITLDAFCSSSCKGLCLVCGTNLNTSRCNCSKETTRTSDVRRSRPLKDLLKPIQKR